MDDYLFLDDKEFNAIYNNHKLKKLYINNIDRNIPKHPSLKKLSFIYEPKYKQYMQDILISNIKVHVKCDIDIYDFVSNPNIIKLTIKNKYSMFKSTTKAIINNNIGICNIEKLKLIDVELNGVYETQLMNIIESNKGKSRFKKVKAICIKQYF